MFLKKLEYLMQKTNIKNLHVLSEKANIPYSTLRNFYDRQDGTEKIKLTTLRQLKTFFGCSLDYLVDDDIEINEIDNTDIIDSSYQIAASTKEKIDISEVDDETKDIIKKIIERNTKEK